MAHDRPVVNIVIREIVNKFQARKHFQPGTEENALSTAIAASQRQIEDKEELEAETLFDDSETPTASPTRKIPTSSEICEENDSDDALFDEVETQDFDVKNQKETLSNVKAANPSTSATPAEKKVYQCAFVTGGGKTTSVSFETYEACRRKLEDEIDSTPTKTATTKEIPSTKIITDFKTGNGRTTKVSTKAFTASKKVFDQIDDQIDLPKVPSIRKLSDSKNDGSDLASEAGKTKVTKNAACSFGFSTARGNAVQASEKALKEVQRLFREELGEDLAQVMNSEEKEKNDGEEEEEKMTENNEPSISEVSTSKHQLKNQLESQDTKTPIRKIAGLKKRTPMCHTGLNRVSSPITPLRDPSIKSNSTPFRPHQRRKQPIKESLVLNSAENQKNGREISEKIKLQDLTLVDVPIATAGSTWFKDDVSGRKVCLEDIKRSFRREVNVERSDFDLWFANHFELVVWKLASYSVRIKELSGCLTIENVLDQLKERWNIERNAKRSSLRMIVERDAPAEATIVLLVKEVHQKHLLLSDGWYSIPCDMDGPLQKLIDKKLIQCGQKLCIFGAQLKGAPNGVDPLQLEDCRLTINFNSTRRARWFAKLGYLRKPLLVPLNSIRLNGGFLPSIRIHVTSGSSLMFFEKFSQGGSIIRREADELKEQKKFFEEMSSIQEKIREDVLRKFELERASERKIQTRSRRKVNVSSLTTGEEIFAALENSFSPSQLMEELSSSQRRTLRNYRTTAEEKFRARVEDESRRILEEMKTRNECPEERKVAPLLKLMVSCCLSKIEVPLTVWRPSEDLRSMLRVGATITIHKANVTTCRKFPFGLTTTNSTAFELFEESMEQENASKRARKS